MCNTICQIKCVCLMLSKLELNRNKWIKMFGISLSKSKENMIIKIKNKKKSGNEYSFRYWLCLFPETDIKQANSGNICFPSLHLLILWRFFCELSGRGYGEWKQGAGWGRSSRTERSRSCRYGIQHTVLSLPAWAVWQGASQYGHPACAWGLRPKTPVWKAWNWRWQSICPISAWCLVKRNSDHKGKHHWNKHGSCSPVPSHRSPWCLGSSFVAAGRICLFSCWGNRKRNGTLGCCKLAGRKAWDLPLTNRLCCYLNGA